MKQTNNNFIKIKKIKLVFLYNKKIKKNKKYNLIKC